MNIVRLNDFDRSQRGPLALDTKELLRECRSIASEHLARVLTSMMNGVDDALFKLAEKAENNAVQSSYFDAMREVRIKRATMESECNAEFIRGFNRELKPGASSGSQASPFESNDFELDLVAHEDLEESLAVKSMIVKIQVNHKQELGALDRRMGFLLGDPDLERVNNPLGPEVFCNAFRIACDQIESGIKVKLIILKLFDRYVVNEHIGKIYQEVNRYLISKNVLPKIRHSVRNGQGVVYGQRSSSGVSGEAMPDEEQDVFATMQELMGGGVAGAPGGGMGGMGGMAGVPGYYAGGVTTSTLLNNLTRMQQGDPELYADSTAGFDMGAVAAGNVNVIRSIQSTGLISKVGANDGMVIDVVAMLFDYILDDENIPGAMKALIGRLQIPLLKVAMMDRTFFSRKSHPARMLLNRLAEAATGWTQAQDDGLYAHVEKTVQRVLVEFEDDVSIFEELDKELDRFLNAEQHEAEQKAKQSLRYAQGKERLKLAKLRVREEVDERTAHQAVPKGVQQFLVTYWQNLLLVTLIKEGEDSIAWKRALTTMDNLMWSVQPKNGAGERDRLVKTLPKLLELLSEGMDVVSMSPGHRENFLSYLSDLHAQIVHTLPQKDADRTDPLAIDAPLSHSVQQAAPYPHQIEEPDPLADDFVEAGPDDGNELEPGDIAESEEVMTATIHRLVEEGDLEVEEITLGSDEEVPTLDEVVEDRYLEQVRELQVGTWVEFRTDDGEVARAKLTWISPVSGVYLFTNRRGLKAAEHTLQGLAIELRRGSARIIEDAPLFDRAVGSVIDDLRKKAG